MVTEACNSTLEEFDYCYVNDTVWLYNGLNNACELWGNYPCVLAQVVFSSYEECTEICITYFTRSRHVNASVAMATSMEDTDSYDETMVDNNDTAVDSLYELSNMTDTIATTVSNGTVTTTTATFINNVLTTRLPERG